MKWKLRIHRKAYHFLENLPKDRKKIIKEKLRELAESLEHGIPPYRRT